MKQNNQEKEKSINEAIKLLKTRGYDVRKGVQETDESVLKSFNEFWDKYGKKVDKDRAFKRWKRMTQGERKKAIAFIPIYHAKETNIQFRKYPLTYLNARLWEDGNDFISSLPSPQPTVAPQPQQLVAADSSISQQIEELKRLASAPQVDMKKEMEVGRFKDMISIYERNPNSLCAKPLIEAYKNGTLKELGIEWQPKDTTSRIP